MKHLIYVLCCVCLFINCKKRAHETTTTSPTGQNGNTGPGNSTNYYKPATITNGMAAPGKPDTEADSFITYLIKKGNNYCERNEYPVTSYTGMHFRAILDSSCIYTTVDPANQEDINKLFGFADCSSFHQTNSARFGWDWYQGAMHIHAYCYSGGVRAYTELGTVPLNKAFDCRLTVLPNKYIFTLEGKSDTMARGCTDAAALGYKLLPYFGGDETAPHDVRVKIREM